MKKKWLLLLPVVVVYITGMFNDVMEPDAAQYASMAVEMLDTGNFLQLHYRGEDYIDKPPLIFWVSAASFKLFGISNFTYKLPSVLFMLLGLYATYRFAKRVYNRRTAFYSTLILATCQAWFLMNQDVKTDNLLVSLTILSLWQLFEFNQNKKFKHILISSLAMTGAMLTKGPIGVMVPLLAMATEFAFRRSWRDIFQWQWLALVLLVFIGILPMLIGLYQQFDLHPGKMTYNGRIDSGLRFYFWTQSFGRLTGESTWKNKSDPFFFIHTFLWAFLPWCIIFLIAFWKKMKRLVRSRFTSSQPGEGILVGGILFPFLAFCLSRYKLPHYIFVIFPLVAIVTGHFLYKMFHEDRYDRHFRSLRVFQGILSGILLLLMLCLCGYAFPMTAVGLWIITALGIALWAVFLFLRTDRFGLIFMPSFIAATLINLLLNAHVYPRLLTYQAPALVSQKVYEEKNTLMAGYKAGAFVLDFYYRKNVPKVESLDELTTNYAGKEMWLFTTPAGLNELKNQVRIVELHDYDDFHVTRLNIRFINPQKRKATLNKVHLLKVIIPTALK